MTKHVFSIRHGWFQSPDRLETAEQQQRQQQWSASRPGRYRSSPADHASASWQYNATDPSNLAHSFAEGGSSSSSRNLQQQFAAAAAAESSQRRSATGTEETRKVIRKKAKEGNRKDTKSSAASAAKLPGDKLLRKLLTEILSLGPEAQAGSTGAGSSSGSSRRASGKSSPSGQSFKVSRHDNEPPSPTCNDEPSLKVLHSDREQQQQRLDPVEQQQQQQQYDLEQRRRAAASAAFQAGLRAAAEEHYQRCTSPDIVDTAVEAAVASAAAAEVARQVKQRQQQQRGDTGRSFDLSSR